MADTSDMIVPMPREMRAENVKPHGETRGALDGVEKRLAALEAAQNTFRRALTADSLLSEVVTGEFEGRIEALERKFAALEAMT